MLYCTNFRSPQNVFGIGTANLYLKHIIIVKHLFSQAKYIFLNYV